MCPDTFPFIQSLNLAGISASEYPTAAHAHEIKCYYRTNTDGTIRWVWPATARHADFLRFYHVSGWKAKLFTAAANMLAPAGQLSWLASGSFSIYIPERLSAEIIHLWSARWAWFSGTIGPARKSLLWHRQNGQSHDIFIKIPLSYTAAQHLYAEHSQLAGLSSFKFAQVTLPAFNTNENGCLQLADIGAGTRRRNRISKLPVKALQEWLETDSRKISFPESAFAASISSLVTKASIIKDERMPLTVMSRLQLLYRNMSKRGVFTSARAHGDFTPWNVLLKNNKLCLIDLELGRRDMPVLYDLFHFVYQSNILIGRQPYKNIRAELDALLQQPQWQQWLQNRQIDAVTAERWYLVYTVAYYLNLYHRQPRWHTQVQWLLNTWSEALAWHLQQPAHTTARELLLEDIGNLLKEKKYALLKWYYKDISSLPETSDLDICITKTDARRLIKELEQHSLVARLTTVAESHMFRLELLLADGSLLHLDLIHTFMRKSLLYLDAGAVLQRASSNRYGLRVPDVKDDFLYTVMFYWLNGAELPSKYAAHFSSRTAAEQLQMLQALHDSSGLQLPDISAAFDNAEMHSAAIYRKLLSVKQNKGLYRFANLLRYAGNVLQGLLPRKGYIITFSGVDGAGKSTVIDNIRYRIDKQLRRKVVVLRHRPSLLPILSAWKHGRKEAENIAAARLPRKGSNNSKWSSLLRFAYYYADYLAGQWVIQVRYVMRGYIVLYDRYYFDFINDARRSNINLSPAFTHGFYRLLMKPRLNIFLYADADIILQRKQELEATVIQQLTDRYLTLFHRLDAGPGKAKYVALENNELENTLGVIFSYIKTMVHETAA